MNVRGYGNSGNWSFDIGFGSGNFKWGIATMLLVRMYIKRI